MAMLPWNTITSPPIKMAIATPSATKSNPFVVSILFLSTRLSQSFLLELNGKLFTVYREKFTEIIELIPAQLLKSIQENQG